jgi:membrane protein implicated in regulation of membrane protease activity
VPSANGLRLPILGTIVVLVLLAVALVLGVTVSGHASDSTPLVTSVLGFIALAIVTLLNLLSTRRVGEETRHIGEQVNGRLDHVEERVDHAAETIEQAALRRGAEG